MKKGLKGLAVLLASASVLAAAGCGGAGDGGNGKETLKITVSNLGFGTKWLDEIVDAFEDIYDVNVDVTPTVVANDLLKQLETGYQLDDLCMFAGVDYVWTPLRKGMYLQIDDVWNYTNEGETQTIREKTFEVFQQAFEHKGHYYSMPFITEIGGFGYNATTLDTLLGEGEWKKPKTTYELDALCDRIKAAGGYAFTWSNKENSCYWGMPISVWEAQWTTADFYNHARNGEAYDEESDSWVLDMTGEKIVPTKTEGLLKASEVAFPYINKDYGYSHQYSTSMTFVESQAAFAGVPYANDKKLVAFTPTGSWLYEESMEDIEYKLQEVGFMNAPVLSALSEKCSYYKTNKNFMELTASEKRAYDAALSAIVAYVDGDTTEKPVTVGALTVTDEDIELIREARKVAWTKDQAHAFVPKNAKNPELAKEFLRFFASDYAGELYSNATHGFTPYYTKITDGNKDFMNRFDEEVAEVINFCENKINTYIGVGFRMAGIDYEYAFFNADASKVYSACESVKNNDLRYWQENLRNAGLLN